MRRPNLLLIQTDQQKATSLDLYNTDRNFIRTDALRRIAEAGVVCEAGYCPYPLCVPSRIAMVTGRYPSELGYVGNRPYPLDCDAPNLFRHLRHNGYRSMLVGKDHAIGLPWDEGGSVAEKWRGNRAIQDSFDWVYATFHGGNMTPDTRADQPHIQSFLDQADQLQHLWGSAVAPFDGDQSQSARMCEVAVDYLDTWKRDDAGADTPFAMWLSFPDPHEFYQAPRDVVARVRSDDLGAPHGADVDLGDRAEYIQFMRWYFNSGGVPREVIDQLVRVYLAMCLNVDEQLRRVLDHLERIGEWDNTLIVYCSDHGDFNGDLGLVQKFNAGYDGCCRVPFVMAFPGRGPGGLRSREPVNLADLPATICDGLGVAALPGDRGRSLMPIVVGEEHEEAAYTVVESGVPGESLSTRDIANFADHRWDVQPDGRWCYDPPHRFGGRMYAVRSADHKLIVREGQCSEFYDLVADPWELRNAIDDPQHAQLVATHHEYLVEHLCQRAPVPPGTTIADQDAVYRAGGNLSWAESLALHRGVQGVPV
ncbi:MAG: sulfatase-like hydrolase/transferase [Planctomycetota bacterium]|nr:sulfatase-like hydrolase/transferase [Planctomycetota bacterium]